MTRVDIGLSPGADRDTVSAALESRLTAQPYVLSSPQDLAAALAASTADFKSTTALIAAIALFAGAFLIFNTLSMTVSERIREVGLLRAAGARRGQVMSFMLTQALVLGVVGSVLGLVLGALLAAGMVAFVRTVGSVTLERPALPLDAIVFALIVGIGVTLAAALEPARRASRIQPVEALTPRLDRPAARSARLRWLAVVFGVVALVGVLVLPRGAGGERGRPRPRRLRHPARRDAAHPVRPARPSSGSPARRSRPSSGSRSGSPAARSSATGAGPR